jgi:capsular polysaccharide biosynthesis protein
VTSALPRRPGPLALLLALIAAVLAAAFTSLVVPDTKTGFTSVAMVSVDEPQAVAVARDGAILDKLSRVRFKYVGLVGTDAIAGPVAKKLRLPVEQVRGRLGAIALPTDLLMRLSCTGKTSAEAARCANALAVSVVEFVASEQQSNGIPKALQLVATSVQAAGPGTAAASHKKRVLGISLLVGALAGAVVLGAAARPRR